MTVYVLKRLAESVIVLAAVSILAFALMHLAPGDPINAMYGERSQELRPEDRQRIIHNFGLDQPLPVQYFYWVKQALSGDFGYSYLTGRPVINTLMERFPATCILVIVAAVLIVFLSLSLGLATGLHPGSTLDRMVSILSLTLISTPGFWLALMLILLFGVELRVLPTAGIYTTGREPSAPDLARHIILPALVLAFGHLGYYIRFIRARISEELGLDYVQSLQARGLKPNRIVMRHVLKNSLIPFINYFGVTISTMLGGAVVVESVFAWPGLGQVSVAAAVSHDYSLLMGSVLLTGFLVICGNLLADVACALIDPRIAAGVNKQEGVWLQ